jgi:hypothetical protein
MPFALPLGAVAEFVAEVPGLHLVDALTYAEPYPDRVPLFALLSLSRTLKNTVAPGLIHARV